MTNEIKAYDDVAAAIKKMISQTKPKSHWELRYYEEASTEPWYASDDLGYEAWFKTIMEALAWLTSRNSK